ncbi:MAG: NUDIX domain-containing protein [Cytophagaceae bacterium]
MKSEIIKVFGNRLRVRVCGICIDEQGILLVKHHALGPKGVFWSPPGGGLEFGESAEESLKREFLEETGLQTEVTRFLFTHEFLQEPLHAIELFFEVRKTGGTLKTGSDPEMKDENQIIQEVKYVSPEDLKTFDPATLHNIFRLVAAPKEVVNLEGYILFKPS